MPDPPSKDFIDACRARIGDGAVEKAVDCILALPVVNDETLATCPGRDQLPLYFHF